MYLLRLHRKARQQGIYRRSCRVAVVVGTLLNLINQPQAILGLIPPEFAGLAQLDVKKAMLTYAVPFLVASYGAFTALGEPTVSDSVKPPH